MTGANDAGALFALTKYIESHALRAEAVGSGEAEPGWGCLTYAAAAASLQEALRSAFGVFRERVVLQQLRVGAQSQDLRGVNGRLLPTVHTSLQPPDKIMTVACHS